MHNVTLVVPCFNEALRLPIQSFACHANIRFVFVDDGSSDGTLSVLRDVQSNYSHFAVLALPKNVGKAEAVRLGMLYAEKSFADSQWFGFWDADLATSLSEVVHFLSYVMTYYPECQGVWGSRVYRLGSHIKRSALRHYLGRGFATIIAHTLQVEAYDTQCGAKIFRREVIQKGFSERFISRWIFDVEILLRLGQHHIVEYPLQSWVDVPGSKVKIFREMIRVLIDIFRIRRRYLKFKS